MEGKLGPAGEGPSPATAAARLEAYERVARVALAGKEGVAHAPVFYLSDEQLAALFAPRQLENLVKRPLWREVPECGDPGQT